MLLRPRSRRLFEYGSIARHIDRAHRSDTLIIFILLFVIGGLSCPNLRRGNHDLSTPAPQGRHAVVISVDGLGSEFLEQKLQEGRLPNLARLRAEGSWAEGVTGTYPSETKPAHTTLVTGKPPAEHGIYTNDKWRVSGKKTWSSEDIRIPTLWDATRHAHLSSAAISWPLAAETAINWDLSGLLDPGNAREAQLRRIAGNATPGMIEEVLYGLGQIVLGAGDDAVRTRIAVYLMEKHKPNLLLLHFKDLDHVEHRYGPASPEAAATIERIDGYIGALLAALKESGLENTTDVFVVSDHGFMSYDIESQPNVLLAKAGLLIVNEHGKIIGGKVHTESNDGSFFLYWPESAHLKAQVEAALRPLCDLGLVRSVLYRDALAKLGADPAVQMALEAPAGAIFGSHATGPLIQSLKRTRGAHGYLPSRRELQAVFIASGPGIRSGGDLHRVQLTDICPTILTALGISDPQSGSNLAIFMPGCCSNSSPVWSGIQTAKPETFVNSSQGQP